MALYTRSQVINHITQIITANGTRSITGPVLNAVLDYMVDRMYQASEIKVTVEGITAETLDQVITPSVDFVGFDGGEQTLSNGSIIIEPSTPVELECYPVVFEPYSQARWEIFNSAAGFSEFYYGNRVTVLLASSGVYSVRCQLLKANLSVVTEKVVQDFIEITSSLSTTKRITSFVFEVSNNPGLESNQVCSINESTGEITHELPQDTNLTSLVPTISYTGASISPLSGVAQDFSSTVVYTVTAQDASTKSYDVNLTVNTPIPSTEVLYGYRTSDQGQLLTTDPDFEDIVTGIMNETQQDSILDSSPEHITLDFTAFGISPFVASWHWFAVPSTVADYIWCDWVGNLGTPKVISTKIKTGDPVSVSVGGVDYKLYRLLFDTSGNWIFSVNEIL